VANYGNSAQIWQTHTQTPEFTEKLENIIRDYGMENDARAAAVEKYIIQEAITVGVVKEIVIK
jgi:hypothetical protein